MRLERDVRGLDESLYCTRSPSLPLSPLAVTVVVMAQ